jgi:hypothetical protein
MRTAVSAVVFVLALVFCLFRSSTRQPFPTPELESLAAGSDGSVSKAPLERSLAPVFAGTSLRTRPQPKGAKTLANVARYKLAHVIGFFFPKQTFRSLGGYKGRLSLGRAPPVHV